MNRPPPNPPARILFVDDEPRVLEAISRSLHHGNEPWSCAFANSVDEAIRHLENNPVDVIVTDVTMPERDGFELIRAVSESARWRHIPVIVLTGLADAELKRRALDAGAFDLLGKPVQRDELIARLRSVLRTKQSQDQLAEMNKTLERRVAERTRELEASQTDILICLAMAGECRDTETGNHLIRVARYARRLAEAAGIDPAEVDMIFRASPLHDIGKLGIPDHVLLKPGPLDADERRLMQTHCEIGHRILTTPAAVAATFAGIATSDRGSVSALLRAAGAIALSHHERWDGTGYPQKLAGEDIPLAARVVAIVDAYDALTSRRPYKLPMPHAAAMDRLAADAGTHFDPQLVATFLSVAADIDAIRRSWLDSDAAREGDTVATLGTLYGTTARRSA